MKKFRNNILNYNNTIGQALNLLEKCFHKNLIILDNSKRVIGVLTDGDIRRALIKKKSLSSKIKSIVKKKFIFFLDKKYSRSKIKKIFLKDNRIELIPVLSINMQIKDILTRESFELVKKKRIKKNKATKIIIMAGGKGVRLKPLTNVIPKPLVPINKKTVIENIMNKFKSYGFDNFYISINYKSYLLKSFFRELGNVYNVKFIEEKKPLGTAGSLSLIKKEKNIQNYFISNCDTIIKSNLNLLLKKHIKSKKILSLIVCKKKYNLSYGVCQLDKDKNFLKIKEKPSIDMVINTGIYIVNKKILDYFKIKKKLNMDKVIKKFTLLKEINLIEISNNSWSDVGQTEEYKKFINNYNV